MNNPFFKRSVSFVLALVLVLFAAPVGAKAFTLIQLKGTDVTLDETVFQYTGEEIRPNVTVKVNDRLLTLDKDYRLEYRDNIAVGTGKVIVTGISTASTTVGYTGTVEIPFEISEKAPAFTILPLKGTDVTIDGTEFVYTGSPIEPGITVTVEGKTLVKDRDYRVSFRNNVTPGTATVTVTGIGTASTTVGYSGTVEIPYTILPYTLKEGQVTMEGTEFPYTGSHITPAVSVKANGQHLIAGEHFTLTYRSNLEPGTATVSVTGIEAAGYTGQVNLDFTITKPALYTLKGTDVTIAGTSFPYTGSYITPEITVTVKGQVLTPGVHYALSYHNNIAAGTATASISGIEDAGYTGQVNIDFTITPEEEGPGYVQIPLTEKNVSIEGTSFPYTGKAVEPKVTVTVEGKKLTEGKDYSLSYVNNIEPGTATAIVRGKGTASENLGYSGEVKMTFTIVKAEEKPEEKPEQKPEQKPEVKPDQKPEQKPEDKPEQPPEQKPEDKPEQTPETKPESVTYKITKGDKATWYKNSAKSLSFTANGKYSDFEGVEIDGKKLDSKYFTAADGTVVTLKSAFLQKLTAGKHTIAILFGDGQADGSFTVAANMDTTNPETSDSFNMVLWMSVMGVSVLSAAALLLLRKKIF